MSQSRSLLRKGELEVSAGCKWHASSLSDGLGASQPFWVPLLTIALDGAGWPRGKLPKGHKKNFQKVTECHNGKAVRLGTKEWSKIFAEQHLLHLSWAVPRSPHPLPLPSPFPSICAYWPFIKLEDFVSYSGLEWSKSSRDTLWNACSTHIPLSRDCLYS